jgi:hypothetical protein
MLLVVCLRETPPLVVLSHMDNGAFPTLADELTNAAAYLFGPERPG